MLADARYELVLQYGAFAGEAPVNRGVGTGSGPVQALGELGALALAQAAESLARRDLAALQNLGCLYAPVLGEGQQHVKDLRGLQVWGRVEQQRTDGHPASLEVPFELRAKRTNLVGRSEGVHALIQVALGCHPVLERVLLGDDIGAETTRAPSVSRRETPAPKAGCSSRTSLGSIEVASRPSLALATITTAA